MEIVAVAMLATMMLALGAALGRKKHEHSSILEGVAEARGGRIIDRRLVLELGALRISVEVKPAVVGGHESAPSHVRWRAELPAPGTTSFRIYSENMKSLANKMFGGRDVQLDVLPAFDQLFMVRADDEPALRRMWRLEACRLMTRHFSEGRAHGGDREIVLEAPLHGYTPEDIDAGIDLLIELARADLYGVEALRQLPDAKPLDAGRVHLPGPGEIRIGPYRDGERVVTRLSSNVLAVGKVLLPEALGRATLVCEDGETTITWTAIEEDHERLLAAVSFVRSFVTPAAQGVFR